MKTLSLGMVAAACLLLFTSVLSAQSVSGVIREAGSGEPLIGVSILVKGTTSGTVTDLDGNYTINVAPTGTLIVSYTGMATREIPVNNRATIDVELKESAILTEQVVVTAYGTKKKGAFTGSATQINAEALETRSITNVTEALEGAGGIQYTPGSGQPGSSSGIRVRGIGSVNASSSPLYVVDGIIFSGNLNSINPNDIESLTVLKDASSTALYGAKAANGVVLITTKSGNGKPRITLRATQGFTGRALPEYERVNAQQYYPLMWEALRNSAVSGGATLDEANAAASAGIFDELQTNPFNVANDQIVGTDGQLNPNAELLYPDDLDWQEPLTRNGNRSNYDLSYQGGNDITTYYASASYLNDKGWIEQADFERFSGRVNVATQPKDWLKTGINLSGATSVGNQANDGGSNSFVNPFFSTRTIAPIYPVYEHNPDGSFVLDDAGERIFDLGVNRVGNTNGRHVIQETLLNRDIQNITTIGARSFVDFMPLEGLKFTVNAGFDRRSFLGETFDNALVGDGAPAGRASRATSTTSSLSFNQLLQYDVNFGASSVTALVGHESFKYEFNFLSGNRQGLIAEGNTELINFTTTSNLSSLTREYNTEGYLARLEYDFDDRYYLSTSFRRDGSSRFDESVRWGNFFSVGGAWRLDQENFIQDLGFFDLLKLRASYGEVGNDSNLSNASLSFYASQALFGLNNNNASEPGILFATLASPTLEWESNNQTDVALEFGFLDYRVSGSVEYYHRTTDNLIFNVPLPLSSGVDSRNANIGSMFNRGVEIVLDLAIIDKPNFGFDLSLNGATVYNEFTELPQEEIITGTKKLVVGGGIFDYFLRSYVGVDPEDGSALYRLDPEADPEGTSPTTRMFNGELVTIESNDALREFQGTALPDLFGSVSPKFRIGPVRLGALFTYQIGGLTYDGNYAQLMDAGRYGTALHVDALNRWQQPGDITNVPRLDDSQLADFGAASSRWLVNSDFLALRQVNVTYTLPTTLIGKLGLQSGSVFFNAENLWQNTARVGMDVNQSFNGTTSNRFTPTRAVILGLNVQF